MAQSKHTGRPSALLSKSGLVAAFLAGTGAGMVAPTAHADGIVRCWGRNDLGQCDVPADLGRSVAIAGGNAHTVAIRTDGTVRAWGSNQYGQCDVPADLGPCTAIAATIHTVAIRTDGTVRAWGYNHFGQCNVPANVGTCIAIAAGYSHTVALSSAGAVRCWGWNGNTEVQGICDTPTDLGPCTAIAATWWHTVALRQDGVVRAWGANFAGQCNVPNDLGPCTAVAAGVTHSLVLRANGSIACWGFNDTQGWCESERTPLSAVAISAGDQFTAALTSTMTVSVWPYLRYCDADDGCFTNGQIAVESPLMINCSGQHLVVLAADCSTSCNASISGNCQVDGADLGILLNQWGPCPAGTTGCAGDINADGAVNGADLGYLLNAWGPCPN